MLCYRCGRESFYLGGVNLSELGDYHLPIALCRLHLKRQHWVPLGISTKISSKHRSSPLGPVVTAEISAAVEDGHVVAWGEPNFRIQAVDAKGGVEQPSSTYAVRTMEASRQDEEAAANGAIGISQKLLDRNPDPPAWFPSKAVQNAAFERAAIMILDKVHGGPAMGVTLACTHIK